MQKNSHSNGELESKSFWYSERVLFVGTILVFLISAILLTITEKNNIKIQPHNSFIDYLFNSISVGTLTGLFRGESGNYTFWGQAILLFNMIICGIISSVISILLILFVRVGLNRRGSLEHEATRLGLDSSEVVSFIFIDLILILGLGTILFLITGVSDLWEGLFNASSHILNDGITSLTNNMIRYRENIPMLISGAFLITIGGIGIGIRAIFYKWLLNILGLKALATKIPNSILAPKNFAITVLILTFALQCFGAFVIYIGESSNPNTLGALSPINSWANSYYLSVSSRTAGFTTVPDLNLASDKTIFILILLMSIGASSGSFAGGIFKLTAIIFLAVYFISRFRGEKELRTKKGFIHFGEKTYIEANFRVLGFTTVTILTTILLFYFSPEASGYWLLFEAVSGVTNTGLSLGATGILNPIGLSLIMFLMVVGKLGFISFIISFFPKVQDLLQNAEKGRDEFPVD